MRIDSAPRGRVLLLQPDAETLAAWVQALADNILTAVTHVDDIDRSLAQEIPEIVVCEWHEGLLDHFSRLPRRPHIIHCARQLPEAVVEAVRQGFPVSHVDDVDSLRDCVRALVAPRAPRLRWHPDGFEVSAGGIAPCRLLEISTLGFSFALPAAENIEPLLPGATLEPLVIRFGGEIVLDGALAVVKHIAPIEQPVRGYRVGCELMPLPDPPSGETTQLRDRAVCAALLRRAIGDSGFVLWRDGDTRLFSCSAGRVDPGSRQLVLPALAGAFEEHDVVHGRFEVGGSGYRFVSSVLATMPLRLRLPSVIEETYRRSSVRYRPLPSHRLIAELSSPLVGMPMLRPVRDLSSTGFSFDIDGAVDLFPPGMHLSVAIGRSLGEEIVCRGRVKHLSRMPGDPNALRCGVEFTDSDQATRLRLADMIMRSRYQGLADGSTVDFESLWKFFHETGFMSPEKEHVLDPMMSEIRRMHERLHASSSNVFKSVVVREEGELVAHVSGLRAYGNTWMFQHLAARPGQDAGGLVSLAAIDYLMQNVEFDYFKMWFFQSALFPLRVFGAFAMRILDPQLSDLRSYAHFMVPTASDLPPHAGVEVIEATGEDLLPVERHLVISERGLLVRSDDLTRGALALSDVDASFRKLGLSRRRRVLLALRKGVPVGFALVEVSTPGLNLSEALSSCRVIVLPEAAGAAQDVRLALLEKAVAIYRLNGRSYARCLVAPDEVAAWERVGMVMDKQRSLSWTCHRNQLRRFADHMEEFFGRLRARRVR